MNNQVVILCGGMGTRLREETEYRPKPLVEIGGKPILWHIMKIYSHYGFKDFVLALGYKGFMIKEYFLNFLLMNSDFTLRLGSPERPQIHNTNAQEDWSITFAETGVEAMTGARVKRVEPYIRGDTFMLTYGDGVADVNIAELLRFHHTHGKIGTVTAVHPVSRFGELEMDGSRVVQFSEKPQTREGLINGGFFVFQKRFLDYLVHGDACVLERDPLERLASDGELMTYVHEGFWHCMDTYRDFLSLNELWKKDASWRTWSS